ncbi:PREDICTED: dehydrogenase/reductase SDR family member 11-like [Polistes dominula]|uniref:Dehydrogenase/reductase SDR family member 11-like n=1 Tax=Polistes dominula TaxID=743375 RepID=A0ABM1J7G5_POLDO|nr:PREDICTED: dehydrogenase/reductase SDR family member 11-like [Polistes dominula]
MERWSGKVALVTGASSGIGANIVTELVRYNVKVVAIDIQFNKLEELKVKIESLNLPGTIYPMKCDLTKEEEILNVFKYIQKEHDEVNILINNAVIYHIPLFADGKTENFRNIMDVNVIAAAICIREAVRLMSKSKNQGHIINITSISSRNAGNIKIPLSLYAGSKYALRAMCENVRNEILSDGLNIKISNISPGLVDTDMIKIFNVPPELLSKLKLLSTKNITDGIIYALASPINVEIDELAITPLHGVIPDKI